MSLPTVSDLRLEAGPEAAPDAVLRLQEVSVRYRVPQERIRSLREYTIRLMQGRISYNAFWALNRLSLEVRRGEVLGIIGRNGAGKSTLLKVVSRVLRPTVGRVWVKGRVAPLLEFQAGFHPELTGRENVFLNGTLLGFTRRQMEDKFERIVDFAELWDFIDAPLRTYSSGMVARLGFSIATDEQPEILLVDEVLSVGDEAFRRKSSARMQEFRSQGTTILFVSHNMDALREMCTRAIWLERGNLALAGDPAQVIEVYRQDKDRVAESEERDRALRRRVGRPAVGWRRRGA